MPSRTPAEILARIEKIEIRSRNIVSEIFSGEYHSSFKGQGLEFAEVREYQSGDNYRDIDWNVSARLGVPYVKKFRETRELNVMFIVDVSASQSFGTVSMSKKERQAEIIALLSFSALSNHDKVGLIMFSDGLEKYLPPRKGRNKALEILRDVLYLEPKSLMTSLSGAFTFANLILKKRSVVFILSDFMDMDYSKPLKILAQKHDVIAVQVLDDAELTLPRAGILRVADPETGEEAWINTGSERIRSMYAARIKSQQAELVRSLRQIKVDHLVIRGHDSHVDILRDFFERRRHRRRSRR